MYVNYENSTVSIDLTTMITKDKHDKYVHTPFCKKKFTSRFLTTVSIIWVKRTFSESFIKIWSRLLEKMSYLYFQYQGRPNILHIYYIYEYWKQTNKRHCITYVVVAKIIKA